MKKIGGSMPLHPSIAAYLERGPMLKRVSVYDTLDDLLAYLSTDEINQVTSAYLRYIFQQSQPNNNNATKNGPNNSKAIRALLASFIFAKFYIEREQEQEQEQEKEQEQEQEPEPGQALHSTALRLTTIMDAMTLCLDGEEEDDFAEDPTGITAIFLECLADFMLELEVWSRVYNQPKCTINIGKKLQGWLLPGWLGLMIKAS